MRVARKLPELPRIAKAFERGALSYSKVRAMTRVGTSANEAYLRELGLHGSASHVTSLVGKYRGVQRLAEIGELNERHAERSVWCYYDDYGMLVIEGRLPPEQGAVVVQALQAAVDTLWKAEVEEDDSDETTKVACARMAPLPFGGVGGDASAASVDNSSIRRERVTARRADGLVLMAETLLSRGAGVLSGGGRYQVVMHVDRESLSDDGEGERCELDNGPGLAKPTARRIACDASLVGIEEDADGTPLNIGRKTRTVPPAIRRALRSRDAGCRFPGCTNRHVDAHHVHHWADGGETSLSNLVQICRRHHRLVHEGGFEVRVTGTGDFIFSRPDDFDIESIPAPPPSTAFNADALARQNAHLGLDIDDQTCVADRHGGHGLRDGGGGAAVLR